MLSHLPLALSVVVLIASSLRAVATVLANRRKPAPAIEQLSNGLGYGLTIGAAFVTVCLIVSEYLF